jgi:type VI secretion system protein ImpE
VPTAQELYSSGRLDAAIEQLGVELRSNPTDVQRRSFLFELLVFSGQYDRAEKQLDVLAKASAMAEAGTLQYKAAIQAERIREHMFGTGDFPTTVAPSPVSGTLNGKPFSAIEDADPRLGARLEVIAGGRYLWVPLAHVARLEIEAPKQLRDVRWMPARLSTAPALRHMELGEVLIPSLSSAAWKHDDFEIRMGRATDWDELPDGDFAPVGQKIFRVDGVDVPLMEIRELVLATGEATVQ